MTSVNSSSIVRDLETDAAYTIDAYTRTVFNVKRAYPAILYKQYSIYLTLNHLPPSLLSFFLSFLPEVVRCRQFRA